MSTYNPDIIERRIFQLRAKENYIAVHCFKFKAGNKRNEHYAGVRARIQKERMPFACMQRMRAIIDNEPHWVQHTGDNVDRVLAAIANGVPMQIVRDDVETGCE